MPSENVILVERVYNAFEARDFVTFFRLLSPNVQITQCPEVPWGGVFHGLEEARRFFETLSTYLESDVSIERFIDGGSRIAVCGRTNGTVKGTGRKFDVAVMHLWEFHNGLAVRLEIVLDVPTMRAALAA